MTTPPPVRTPSPVSPALPLSTLATWFFGDWRRSAGFQIYVGVYFVLCILGGLYAFTGNGFASGTIRVGVSCDYKASLTAETCAASTETGRYWIREIEVILHGESEPGYTGPRPDPSAYRAYQLRTVFRAFAGLIFLLPAAALAQQERAGRTFVQWYGWMTVLSAAVFLTDFAISWWCSQTITNALSLPGLRITGLHWGPPWSLGYLVFGAMAYLQYRTLAKRAPQAAVKVESTPTGEGTGL